MQTPTPLAPKDARQIALRQGILSGTIAGCLSLLFSTSRSFIPFAVLSFNVIYIFAFIAFFVAGWRAAKRTGRLDMGALAGFWAGVAVAILGLVALIVSLLEEYSGLSSTVMAASSGIPIALLALLLGAAIGILGGFIGRAYANNPAPQPATPTQPPLSQPAPLAQPTQPPPQQNQP